MIELVPPSSAARPVFFRAILHPHRSLSPAGFRWLMLAITGLSLGVGTLFFLNGAWPIVGFLGLDVALVYWAFRASYRSARLYETVELDESALTVERVEAERPVRSWQFQPAWLRVSLDGPEEGAGHVLLSSHGRHLVVGGFLPPQERQDLAQDLTAALHRWRLPPHLQGQPL